MTRNLRISNANDKSSIRIVPELRAIHLAREAALTPATWLYFDEKYDLGGEPVPPQYRRVNLRQCLVYFWNASETILEVPEPLWMRFLPKHILIVVTWLMFGALRRRSRRVVTYAIELNSLATLLGGIRPTGPIITGIAGAALGLYIRLTLTRVSFGTLAAHDLYCSLPWVRRIPHRVILELHPAQLAVPSAPRASSVVFVGELDDRKGVVVLMKAWEIVEAARPNATLTVIGAGRRLVQVLAWADLAPGQREVTGALARPALLELLSQHTVLVAPSLPEGRWREQVGLPIQEALAHGLTIVTTAETGLASWLIEHGHNVVDAIDVDNLVGELARALLEALDNPLDRSLVKGALPEIDAVVQSDSWIHSPESFDQLCRLSH